MGRIGKVFYDNIFCGTISENDEGFIFQYDLEYIKNEEYKPISLTMPKQQEPYISPVLFPFFDGLIPEGWLLEIALTKWNMKANDRMGLLLKVCEDTIGAVSVKGEKE